MDTDKIKDLRARYAAAKQRCSKKTVELIQFDLAYPAALQAICSFRERLVAKADRNEPIDPMMSGLASELEELLRNALVEKNAELDQLSKEAIRLLAELHQPSP